MRYQGILLWGMAATMSACTTAPPHPLHYELYPPIAAGKRYLVAQGFWGKKTHQREPNTYAVDLVMAAGEPVCAVKKGQVSSLFSSDKRRISAENRSNFVRIRHADGSIADYQHLTPRSISVIVGQQVARGDCFAQAGNTGLSTGPHLHFALLIESGRQLVSVPFKFIDPQGRRYTPEYLGWVRN